jgi:predicted ArsR family transcriptional regulator
MHKMIISGPEHNKNRLKKRLLHQLYMVGQASVPQMARMLGVSIPTVKNLMVELLESDEVKSAGIGESNGGRNRSCMSSNAEDFI